MKKTLLASSISAIALSSTLSVQAESLDEFVKGGSVELNFRYRVESADVEGGADAALANTLKSRITVKTGSYYGVSAVVEGDNVFHVTDEFNSTENNETSYDVVKDPETTQLNQSYLQYAGFDTVARFGNQRILLDNQRHVGGVGFRQDEQTYEGLTIENKSIDSTTVFLAVINERNDITNTNREEDVILANVKYAVSKDLAATAFYYGIESLGGNEGADLDTYGLRATGSLSGFSFEAEIATQDQKALDTTPMYYHLNAGTKLGSVKTTLGYEAFGSDDGDSAFATPFGTNHKFFGWSDAYLGGAGANGIQDLYVSAVTNVSGVKLVGQLHKFDAVKGGADLGTEFGFLAAKKFGSYGASLKFAQLVDSDTKPDTTKLWLTGTAKF